MQSKQHLRCGYDRVGRSVLFAYRFWLACLLAMLAFPAACAPPNETKTVQWQEEVKLSTGEVIVVVRETRLKPAVAKPFRQSWAADVMTIRFRYPPDAKEMIEWRTVRHDGTGGGGYRHPEYPLVLDVDPKSKALYVITRAGGTIGGCNEYFRYRYENGAWQDDILPEIFETRPSNLFIDAEKLTTPNYVSLVMSRESGKRKNIRFRQVGPDRCLCGHIGNPVKSGCVQKYKSNKE
jgi:hypothetical protein